MTASAGWQSIVTMPRMWLAAGLAAVAGRAEVAFVSSTDMPFLHPAFVRRVLRAAQEGADVGLPVARGYPQPLAASYRVTLAPVAMKKGVSMELDVPVDLEPGPLSRFRVVRLGQDRLKRLAETEYHGGVNPAKEHRPFEKRIHSRKR